MSTACSFADEIRGGKLQGMPLFVIDEQGYLDFYGHRLGPAIVEASKDIDLFEAARGFQGPVRLLHGEKDFIPVEYVRRYLDVYGDQADLTVSPTADHGWTNVSDRDLVESEIVNFIARHARGVQ